MSATKVNAPAAGATGAQQITGQGSAGQNSSSNTGESASTALYADLSRLGVPIFIATPGGTEFRPVSSWQHLDAADNPDRLKTWRPGDAVCAVMGAQLAVVDVDTKNGADPAEIEARLIDAQVPIFAEVETPSGGRHYYVPNSGIGSPTGILPGVDLRGGRADGTGRGFVYLPGTTRPKYNGTGYRIVDNNLAHMPDNGDPAGGARFVAWRESLRPPRPTPARGPATPVADVPRTRLDAYTVPIVDEVRTAPEHERNSTLYKAACRFAELGYPVDTALDTLGDAARAAGLPDTEIRTTVRSGYKTVGANRKAIPDRSATVPELDPTHLDQLAHTNTPTTENDSTTDDTVDGGTRFHALTDGATFILDEPDGTAAVWGSGDDVLWAEGEALMIAGLQGLGKTSLAGQLTAASIGLTGPVLGLPVTPADKVLYLAMDRPRQAARALRRQLGHADRALLADRLTVWKGPPLADMAKQPGLLTELAAHVDADRVIVDSLKDAAVGLSDDEVGASWNRARQMLLRSGVELVELHHLRKPPAATKHAPDIGDVYGSTWLTSGAGSVLLLSGEPGDAYPQLHHVKSPIEQVGPWRLYHDHTTGVMTVHHGTDLLLMAAEPGGVTAPAAARIEKGEKAGRNDVERIRRRLEKLVSTGQLTSRPGATPTAPTTYHTAVS